jgi:hypothetical protein
VLTPGESIGGIEVNVHVVIRLDDKFRLLTEGGDPQLPEHILVGQVVIGVVKPALQTNLLKFFIVKDNRYKKLCKYRGSTADTPFNYTVHCLY